MGRYMIVVLADEYKNDVFINQLNKELFETYGANNSEKFNSWRYLQEEADYMNNDPEGKKQVPHWKRPITKECLHKNCFWLRMGEFHLKISGGPTAEEAIDAVAVSKWIVRTKGRYINKKECSNYTIKIVKEYLNDTLMEGGYDIKKIWKFPSKNI